MDWSNWGMTRRLHPPFYLQLVLLLSLALLCQGHQIVVHTQLELIAALNDPTVNIVVLGRRKWNFTEDVMHERAAVIRGRNVIFEGMAYEDGSLAYIDGNQLLSRVIITEGAQFLQRNIWVDDCLSSKWPYSCFSITTGGGSRVELRDAIFSDATCVKWSESNGITAMINSAKFVKPLTVKTRDVNERELYVEDTGWVPYVPPTAYWRFVNVSLTCTGNITHDLPPEHIVLVDKRWNKKDQSLAIAITLVVLTTFYWLYFHHFSIPRETLIARKKGFDLQIELGQGRYGKVYRARHRVSGQYVAIKVISLKPTDWKELRAAWRECQVMSSLRHPSCVKIINYYSARVSQGNMVTNMPSPTPTHSTDFVDESTGGGGGGGDDSAIGSTGMASKGGNWGFYDVTAALDDFTARSLGSTELHAAAEAVLSGRRSVLSHSSKKSSEFSTSSASDSLPETDDSNASRVLSAASGDSDLDGLSGAPLDSLLLQVHLVMEYADQGTLYDSIKSGKFMNADRTPALPTVLATALDIGRGLVALHAPRHRMAHRDLSPNNVLLISEFNDRGFRAVLSDFGLSTVVSLGLTHKTSEAKGTLVYMPPELLVDNTVSTAIDIYSFGVLILFMLARQEPYEGLSAGRILSYKLTSGDNQVPVPDSLQNSTDSTVQEILLLVERCTACDRKERPTASQVVKKLEQLLDHHHRL